ncbi:MAG: hypothetical protein AAF317_02795 [Pseudomonadota bacterium]
MTFLLGCNTRRATCQTFRAKAQDPFLRGLPDELYRRRFLIFDAD